MVPMHQVQRNILNGIRQFTLILSGFLTLLTVVGVQSVQAEAISATDQLLSRVLTVNLPSPIYKNPQVTAQFGHYDVKVELAGDAKVSSYPKQVQVSLPLNVTMEAVLSALPMQNPDGTPFSCATQFQTTAQFTVQPNFQKERVTTQTQLNLPVPPAVANCGVMQIPLQPMLQAVVNANQAQWEKDFNAVIEKQLNPTGKSTTPISKL